MVLLQPAHLEEADAAAFLLRFLIDHPQARLVNAWREALIAWETRQGRHLSKNQARQVIERQPFTVEVAEVGQGRAPARVRGAA